MSITTSIQAGETILSAPADGVVRFAAPRQLCGELEVFEAGEVLLWAGQEEVVAPGRGFIVRHLVAEGAFVDAGTPLIQYSAVVCP